MAPSPRSQEDLCPEHKRKLEVVCIETRERICFECAAFGKHRNYDNRKEDEVVSEITLRTEMLIELFQAITANSEDRIF